MSVVNFGSTVRHLGCPPPCSFRHDVEEHGLDETSGRQCCNCRSVRTGPSRALEFVNCEPCFGNHSAGELYEALVVGEEEDLALDRQLSHQIQGCGRSSIVKAYEDIVDDQRH